MRKLPAMAPLILFSCLAEQPQPAGPIDAPPSGGNGSIAVPPDAVAAQTALVVVRLSPDGSVAIGEVSPRPIVFRQQGPRYRQEAHGVHLGDPPPATVGDDPTDSVLPGAGARPDPVSPGATARSLTAAGDAIVVRHALLDEPVVVPLDLGHPGEGGGDVLDRWQDGVVILRAPYLGPGTHYTIVKAGVTGPTALAEWEVIP